MRHARTLGGPPASGTAPSAPSGPRTPGGIVALAAWVRRVARVVRTLIGAPDYDRYVAHMRLHHPGCAVASHDEFMRQRLESRYSRPGSRCC